MADAQAIKTLAIILASFGVTIIVPTATIWGWRE
jgi:hypothetical protein